MKRFAQTIFFISIAVIASAESKLPSLSELGGSPACDPATRECLTDDRLKFYGKDCSENGYNERRIKANTIYPLPEPLNLLQQDVTDYKTCQQRNILQEAKRNLSWADPRDFEIHTDDQSITNSFYKMKCIEIGFTEESELIRNMISEFDKVNDPTMFSKGQKYDWNDLDICAATLYSRVESKVELEASEDDK